jgi:hypothetical protein
VNYLFEKPDADSNGPLRSPNLEIGIYAILPEFDFLEWNLDEATASSAYSTPSVPQL